ncbi:hypothetical protein APED_10765 [Acanthopleuribacter pedis]
MTPRGMGRPTTPFRPPAPSSKSALLTRAQLFSRSPGGKCGQVLNRVTFSTNHPKSPISNKTCRTCSDPAWFLYYGGGKPPPFFSQNNPLSSLRSDSVPLSRSPIGANGGRPILSWGQNGPAAAFLLPRSPPVSLLRNRLLGSTPTTEPTRTSAVPFCRGGEMGPADVFPDPRLSLFSPKNRRVRVPPLNTGAPVQHQPLSRIERRPVVFAVGARAAGRRLFCPRYQGARRRLSFLDRKKGGSFGD